MLSWFTSENWWKGASVGALKGLLMGVAIGIGCALLFQGMFAMGLFPEAAGLFKGFLTLSGGSIAGAVVPWSAFSVLPFALFNGGAGLLTGLLTGGNQALSAEQQQQTRAREEAKLMELDGRTQALEQQVQHSPRVQTILERGPRSATAQLADTSQAHEALSPAHATR